VKEVITIKDKQFDLFIEQEVIEREIKRVAEQINAELEGQGPHFYRGVKRSLYVCR